MPIERERDLQLEIGHVLFIDIVGYSKLLINEQSEVLHELNDLVREAERVRAADAAGKLIRLPAGDGMALVFRDRPEGPAECALGNRAGAEEPYGLKTNFHGFNLIRRAALFRAAGTKMPNPSDAANRCPLRALASHDFHTLFAATRALASGR